MSNKQKSTFQGYPLYPSNEDIYSKFHKESEINPEDISETKKPNENNGISNKKDLNDNITLNDLDIPGSELDDERENIGSEDEENNFYSIGDDIQNDMEEQ